MPKSLEEVSSVPKDLTKLYLKITGDLKSAYHQGTSCCLVGTHGIGKTLTICNILKKASHKSFTCLYTTISDIVSALTTAPTDDKYLARKELTEVDFLVCDEVDSRFVSSEASSDLFGRNFEHILRTRIQNKLPVIMVSNSPNPVEIFQGSLKKSLESLMNKLPIIPILGPDFRKTQQAVSK